VKPEDYEKQGRFEPEMQRRCATLAKMGAVVFSIDMFGCDDSMQVVGQDAHRQPLAFTIQTWNSTRAIDFLLSLDGVDPQRVGVSGYSGGGTQTFMVSALDPRVAVSIPVAMVSSYMFGGCPCESGQPVHRSADHFASKSDDRRPVRAEADAARLRRRRLDAAHAGNRISVHPKNLFPTTVRRRTSPTCTAPPSAMTTVRRNATPPTFFSRRISV